MPVAKTNTRKSNTEANVQTKVETNGVVSKKSKGLRKPQVRILEVLAKSKTPLTRKEIADKGDVDLSFLTEYIGSHDDAIRAKNDAKVCPSLRTLKLVKVEQHDVDGRDTVVHTITAAGKTALEKALA